jgi:AcrR family transcriptional regulator
MKFLLMSKEEAIAQLLKVFRQYGYEGATLARLSKATGLGKASLYHYFPKGKEEMAAAVLNHIDNWLEENILTPLQGSGTPAECIRAMCKSVDMFYNRGQQACLFAVLSLGDAKDLFHVQIRQALKVWIDAIAEVLIEAGIERSLARQRAEDAILQIQGSLVLVRALDDTAPFERVLQRLPETLLN